MFDKQSDFFQKLSENGIEVTPEQREKISNKLNEIINYEPRVGILGKTGVGKSSLCNALFGIDVCAVDHVQACTRDVQELLINIKSKGIKVIDVPGAGESNERDDVYSDLYRNLLPELDIVLWLIKIDDRAFSSDEYFYHNVIKPHLENGKPFFVVVNQIDAAKPYNWDSNTNNPSGDQQALIERKRQAVGNFFNLPLEKILAISAERKYGLVELVDRIIFALPKEKKISFAKNIPNENLSEGARNEATRSFMEVASSVVTNTVMGAKSGAEIGAKIAGPVGAKIGAVVGGTIGFFKGLFGW